MGVVCAMMKFIPVCGDYHSHWDYKCLGDWHITGQCLLSYLTVHLTVLERTYQEAFHNSGFTSFGRVLLPWLGVNVNEAMIRKLSLTLENTTDSIAKTLASQEKSLRLSGQSRFWQQNSSWSSSSWARKCLCCGHQHLLHLDRHFWESWNSVI